MSEDKTEVSSTGVTLPVTATAQVAKDLMELAKNDSNTVEAARNFGESAVIFSKAVKNCLLPLAAVNFGIDKARIYFQKRFAKDLEEKTQHIPPEKIVEPKASIAGPALQGLAFSHEEDSLKELFLNLLSSAMNADDQYKIHPSFVEVVKQLDNLEAKLLNLIIQDANIKIIGRVIYVHPNGIRTKDGNRHILQLLSNGEPFYHPNISIYVDNWVRLGLVEVDYTSTVSFVEKEYDELQERKEYLEDNSNPDPELLKSMMKGCIQRTAFGAQFAEVVGIDTSSKIESL